MFDVDHVRVSKNSAHVHVMLRLGVVFVLIVVGLILMLDLVVSSTLPVHPEIYNVVLPAVRMVNKCVRTDTGAHAMSAIPMIVEKEVDALTQNAVKVSGNVVTYLSVELAYKFVMKLIGVVVFHVHMIMDTVLVEVADVMQIVPVLQIRV